MNEEKFHGRHTYLFVIILELVILATAIVVGIITRKLGLPDYILYGGMMLILVTITVLTLQKMKWWKTIGFIRFNKKYSYLLIIPAIPMIGNLLGSYQMIGVELYAYYFILTIMAGFVEEGIYRGLMLRALIQKGIWKAVIITSLLFSLTHIMNALAGWNWQFVLLQLCYAFAIGFGYAAFALRTGTIWLLMILHWLCDFFSFIKSEDLIKSLQTNQPSLEGMIYDIILSIVFIIYGIVVTRSYIRNEKLNRDNLVNQ